MRLCFYGLYRKKRALISIGNNELQLSDIWGNGIFAPNGEIDRKKLAACVFGDTPDANQQLIKLEKISHPRIRANLEAQIEQFSLDSGIKALVLDAPVMQKSGWDQLCDTIWFVDCERAVRVSRALKRDWSEKEFANREQAQHPIDLKIQVAEQIIDNNGSADETRAKVKRLWTELLKRA